MVSDMKQWDMAVLAMLTCALSTPWRSALKALTPTLLSTRGESPLSCIIPSDITACLRSALALHLDPAYAASDTSICSTQAGGAMAILCADVHSDRIRLLGRWRSDEMYRLLHVQQARPDMTGLAATMLRGSSFRVSPH
jgi:hypothetical protein